MFDLFSKINQTISEYLYIRQLNRSQVKFLQVYIIFLLFCNTLAAQVIQTPDNFHGPRTKWSIYPEISGGASRHSIIPQLSDLSVAQFMYYLESTGANAATLNLENRRSLISTPKHDVFELTPDQINNANYTAGQRSILLTNFLIDVQKAIDKGEILGNIRFHIHQRLYLRKELQREQEFITDFSNFINLCKARGVDHLIAGIRLGEHGTDGSKYLLESALRIAAAINTNTNGWLKEHGGLEWSGDGYGRDFSNINNHGTLSVTFFEEISKYTGYFAFCYKAFGVGGELTDAGLNKNNAADWQTFLGENLGLNQLIEMIKTAREKYPNHANVLFIGDSGDALKLINEPEYSVTTKLFSDAGDGFKGIIAVNGYRRYDKGTDDDNLYFWDALTSHPPVRKPLSIKRWEAWPMNDALLANKKTVYAMASIGGVIEPSGPVHFNPGDTVRINITPLPDYIISDVLVDEVSVGSKPQVIIENISGNHRVQAIFSKNEGEIFNKPVDNSLLGKWVSETDASTLLFNNKYTVYKGSNINTTETYYGMYWFDNTNPWSSNANGEIIVLNNDAISAVATLTFAENDTNRLLLTFPGNNTSHYNRDIKSTGVSTHPLQKTTINYLSKQNILRVDNPENVVRIEIYDMAGRKKFSSSDIKHEIQINKLPKGIYIVRGYLKKNRSITERISIFSS